MRLLAGLGMAALLVAGCSKGAAPTKEQYAGVAERVCTVAHDDLVGKVTEHRKTKPDGGADQRFVRAQVISRLRGMTGELRSIQPPDGDGGYLDSVYRDYEHALDLWYSDPLGPTSDTASEAAEARMATYGMAACAEAADIQVSGDGSD